MGQVWNLSALQEHAAVVELNVESQELRVRTDALDSQLDPLNYSASSTFQ